jgi:hypothetical protein
MKLSKTIQIGRVRIPKGTVLNFGTEGLVVFKGQRIRKSMIPAAAIESQSQRRSNAGVALEHSVRLDGVLIPKGTVLNFGTEGLATYKGMKIKKSQIPEQAYAAEALSPVKLKMPVCVNGKIIPANESLMFDSRGYAAFEGQQISIYDFPTAAIESEELEAHNAVDIDKEFKPFDAIEPGDLGTDNAGQPIRFLGKATGVAGHKALVDQFGDTSGKTIDDFTAGLDQDKVDALQFVAYSTKDGSVMIDIYDAAGGAIATESDGDIEDIVNVQSGDAGVNYDGKPCTIVAKGQGAVWAKNMAEQLGIDDCLKEIREELGVDEDDSLENTWFVLTTNDKNEKCICNYGPTGAKVIKSAEQ